jgi:uncharacterized protein (DUF433 family)
MLAGVTEERMSAVIDIGTLIVRSPDVRSGRPRLAGTGVTVQRIVAWHTLGLTPEEIQREVRHLSLAQVYAALTYYHANHDEIEAGLAQDEADADRLAAEHALSAG